MGQDSYQLSAYLGHASYHWFISGSWTLSLIHIWVMGLNTDSYLGCGLITDSYLGHGPYHWVMGLITDSYLGHGPYHWLISDSWFLFAMICVMIPINSYIKVMICIIGYIWVMFLITDSYLGHGSYLLSYLGHSSYNCLILGSWFLSWLHLGHTFIIYPIWVMVLITDS